MEKLNHYIELTITLTDFLLLVVRLAFASKKRQPLFIT